MEPAQVLIIQSMVKQNVVYPCDEIVLLHKKEQSTDTRYNINKPRKPYATERSQTQKAQSIHGTQSIKRLLVAQILKERDNWVFLFEITNGTR